MLGIFMEAGPAGHIIICQIINTMVIPFKFLGYPRLYQAFFNNAFKTDLALSFVIQ